jgi:putative ABC transport system substrate-binding protein
MRRRELISLLGGTAVAWPFVARSQQAKLPTTGVLVLGSPPPQIFLKGLRDALRDAGYIEGQS